MRDDTTIAIMKSTRQKLEGLKIIEDETYDHLINRFIDEIDQLKKQIKQITKEHGKNKKLC